MRPAASRDSGRGWGRCCRWASGALRPGRRSRAGGRRDHAQQPSAPLRQRLDSRPDERVAVALDDQGLRRALCRDAGLERLVLHRYVAPGPLRDPPGLTARGQSEPGTDGGRVEDGRVLAYESKPTSLDDVLGLLLGEPVGAGDLPQDRGHGRDQLIEGGGVAAEPTVEVGRGPGPYGHGCVGMTDPPWYPCHSPLLDRRPPDRRRTAGGPDDARARHRGGHSCCHGYKEAQAPAVIHLIADNSGSRQARLPANYRITTSG